MELSRGSAAKAAGVNIETLRYYERKGLIPKPKRSAANYRQYSEDTVARVRFVKHAQELGFTLEEIDSLLDLRGSTRARAEDVKNKALEKIAQIEKRIESLSAIRTELIALAETCTESQPASECPILQAIDRGKVRD